MQLAGSLASTPEGSDVCLSTHGNGLHSHAYISTIGPHMSLVLRAIGSMASGENTLIGGHVIPRLNTHHFHAKPSNTTL
jgi:hypothetical protein